MYPVYRKLILNIDSLGNVHTPMCVSFPPMKTEKIELCLLGEFGSAVTNPPVEVRVVDLFSTDTLSGVSLFSNHKLKRITTTNVIPLADGPSLFFAQN